MVYQNCNNDGKRQWTAKVSTLKNTLFFLWEYLSQPIKFLTNISNLDIVQTPQKRLCMSNAWIETQVGDNDGKYTKKVNITSKNNSIKT